MMIFPMAGLSRRFFEAGYDKPKYMLDVLGETLFFRAVQGFRRYFSSRAFLFICRNVYDTPEFVAQQCQKLGIARFEIVTLEEATAGQADTVKQGLARSSLYAASEPLTMFNIDTVQRDFIFPWEAGRTEVPEGAAYVEVFDAQGDHWSFAAPVPEDVGKPFGRVLYTTEKRRVSDLCSTGLYHFTSCGEFAAAHAFMLETGWEGYAEQFVCPIYNVLIKQTVPVFYASVPADDLFLAGTPAEFTALLENERFLSHIRTL